MKEKTNKLFILTQVLTATLLIWVNYYSDESTTLGKSWFKNNNGINSLGVRGGRLLKGEAYLRMDQRNAYLKEKLKGIIDEGDDDITFAKRFNSLIQEDHFKKGLNSVAHNGNYEDDLDTEEYDYIDGDFGKNDHLLVNVQEEPGNKYDLINFDDDYYYENEQQQLPRNNYAQQKSNSFHFQNKFSNLHNSVKGNIKNGKQLEPQNKGSEFEKLHNVFNPHKDMEKKTNTAKPQSEFEKLHNSFKFNNDSKNKSQGIKHESEFEKLHNVFNPHKDMEKKTNTAKPQSEFEKLHNSFKFNNDSKNKSQGIKHESEFEKLHNVFNPHKDMEKKTNTAKPQSEFEKLHNSFKFNNDSKNKSQGIKHESEFEKLHNVFNPHKDMEKKTNTAKPQSEFEKLHNSFKFNNDSKNKSQGIKHESEFEKLHNSFKFNNGSVKKPQPGKLEDDFERRLRELKDDFYADKVFKNTSGHYDHYQTLFGAFNKKDGSNFELNNLNKNNLSNDLGKVTYNLNKQNNFDSEKRGLKLVDDYSSYTDKKYSSLKKDPSIENRSSALKYAQCIEKLMFKLTFYDNVENVVADLKNDANIKKLLDELKEINGFEKLLYILKYSDDSEGLLRELKKDNNAEKLLCVLNYYGTGSKANKKELLKTDLKGIEKVKYYLKKKVLILWLVKMFKKFDKMYENQLLSLFQVGDKSDPKNASEYNRAIHLMKYFKVLSPIALAIVFVALISVIHEFAYIIIVSVIAASAILYTLFKVKKCLYKKKIEAAKREKQN
ncbi:Plasmodium exported protein, unknown function [Plasmodium ovale]|uniref:Pv-fam-d protein n=1 Tax=Plasmodium ovale TaxID=36330 RepID=A0A1C3KFV3_PLAOA|nr:Plasmodium exported protein, unknown function [Plasmodium ovale]